MTTARVPKLPLDEAKAAADEAAVPDYMAELSIFQGCSTIRRWRAPSMTCSPPCCGTVPSTDGCGSW